MQRTLFFVYGISCYLLFFVTYAWLAGFVGNLLLPRSIDFGPPTPIAWAATIDTLLLLAFAVQHSVMARPAFKTWWTRTVPQPIERSTYVLASCLVLILLMCLWRPIDIVIWNVTN